MKKNLNINFKELPTKVLAKTQKLLPYTNIAFVVVVLLAYTFLVLRINSLSKAGPSEDAITEKLQSVKLPKIDKAIIDKIQQLQDNSVDVQTLFKNARDNPFQE